MILYKIVQHKSGAIGIETPTKVLRIMTPKFFKENIEPVLLRESNDKPNKSEGYNREDEDDEFYG